MRHLVCVLVLLCGGCVLYAPGCEHGEPVDFSASPQDLFRGIGSVCNGAGEYCSEGTCCNGICVDLQADPQNCGACGIACPSGVCEGNDLGTAFCACERDGGVPGCSAPTEPQCSANGKCVCGGEYAVCAPPRASGCSASGQCQCGTGPACGGLSDHCDPSVTPSCRCGNEPACDDTIADRCNPKQSPSCGCGSGPACQKGAASCCTWSHTCCPDSQYCCLDGCCNHPCLVFGFCAQ